MRFFICGGGCYGSYYVRQLRRAANRGKLEVDEIIVVDRDSACAVSGDLQGEIPARLWEASWEDIGLELWTQRDELAEDMWVPAPIAPHVVYHWAQAVIGARGRGSAFEPYSGPLPELPFADTIRDGTLVLSHAPGVCPTNCIEPRKCPLTGGPRDWEMKDTVRELVKSEYEGHGIDEVAVVTCQHLEFGVGTIPFADIFAELDRLLQVSTAPGRVLAVATVSSCHGILDAFRTEA